MSEQETVPQTIEQMADNIEESYRRGPGPGGETLVGYLADKVEIVHEPRLENDGFRDGPPLAAMRLRETDAFARALRDFREEASVKIEGDYLLVTKTVSGERANGDKISETVTSKFRVADGKIVAMVAGARSGSFSVLTDVLKEGGFTG